MMQEWSAHGYDGNISFFGELIGYASSQRTQHAPHETPTAIPGFRCSACRWFEVKIFKTVERDYVVEMTGHTTVNGERTRHRVEVTESPHWVIDVLTQRDGDRPFIPLVSKKALAEAAARDEGIESVYVARVVA